MLSWDQRYSEPEFAYGTEPNDFLREHWQFLPKGKVLCLAEGEGRNAVFLASQGFEVTCVDWSAVGLQKAQRLAEQRGVKITTICADLQDFTITPDSWDSIVSIWVHTPPEVRRHIHYQVLLGLKLGGCLLLEAYTPEQIKYGTGGPPAHLVDWMMTLSQLRAELLGLAFIIGREVEREVYEGKYHCGLSKVVQVLAYK